MTTRVLIQNTANNTDELMVTISAPDGKCTLMKPGMAQVFHVYEGFSLTVSEHKLPVERRSALTRGTDALRSLARRCTDKMKRRATDTN